MIQENDSSPRNPEDADSVLHALGLSASLSRASTAPSNVSSLDQSRNIIGSPDISQQQQASSLNDSTSIREQLVEESPKTPLQVVHVNQINIPPKEKVHYTKSTQTPAAEQATPPGESLQQKSYYGKIFNQSALEWDDEFPGI